MSARMDRAELADLRAMGIQNRRQQMHGGGHGSGLFRGAGATPSMGLSQFRGGGSCHKCGRSCSCDDSSSDDEMCGGARLRPIEGIDDYGNGALGYRDEDTGAFYKPEDLGIVTYAGEHAADLPVPTSTQIAIARPSEMKVYNPAEALARLGDLNKPSTSKLSTLTKIAAAALAAGIPVAALAAYLSNMNKSGSSGTSGGPSGGPSGPGGPGGPGGTGGPGTVVPPKNPPVVYQPGRSKGRRTPLNANEVPWYLQTGNLPTGYFQKGGAKGSDGRSARAAIVKKVMAEKGMKMIDASKYVKQHGLYK